MRAFGAPAAEIERVQRALQDRKDHQSQALTTDCFGVWAENLPIAQAWCGVSTQWRAAGMAGALIGLDYAGVAAWLQVFIARREHKEIMQGIQVMERAALAAMAERREQEQGD